MVIDRDKIIRAVASSHAIETDKPTEYWEERLRKMSKDKMQTETHEDDD